MTCDDAELRAEICQRNPVACGVTQLLDDDVECALTSLFEKEIQFNRTMENLKQQISCSKTFDIELAFNCIDDWKYGFIDRKNLKSFFRKHLYLASSRECIAIIRRFDLDADARLNLKEFTEGLKPNEPYSKVLKRLEISKKPRSNSRPESRGTS